MAGRRKRVTREHAVAVEAARSGDRDAFADIYRRYLSEVRTFCARRVGDPVRAEDLAQDAFVKAFEQMSSFRRGAPLWPWLSTIARNLCIDESRHRQRALEEARAESIQSFARDPDPTPEIAIESDRQQRITEAVGSAMNHLTARERRLVWQRAVEQQAWKDIAWQDQSSLDSARNTAWRARGVLRALLADSLQDLRTWLGLTIGTLAARYRRGRSRYQDRLTRWAMEPLASAPITEWILAAGLLAGSFINPGVSRTTDVSPVPDIPRILMAQHEDPRLGIAPEQKPVTALSLSSPLPADGRPIRASASFRPKAVAPASSQGNVVVRAPDGKVLYWFDGNLKCGDGRTIRLVPEWSPVQAYC